MSAALVCLPVLLCACGRKINVTVIDHLLSVEAEAHKGDTVAGILMIPGLYLLGKQLTKRTSVAAFCAALIALDCQHLTQTQIATIDSFPVLFIVFAYFFMLRFMQTNLLREKKAGILLNLAASGFSCYEL